MSAPAASSAAGSAAAATGEEAGATKGGVADGKGKGKEKVVEGEAAPVIPAGGGGGGGGGRGPFVAYPARMAAFKDVVEDAALFKAALKGLHAQMGTKLKVPIIGGKVLDLHKLFKEVTSRGGIDKVKADNRWREIPASFNFPATATNASFMLKKYYISLLSHFEQLYLFEAQGWYQETDSRSIPFIEMKAEDQASQKRKRGSNSSSGLASSDNDVDVIIDGKFEHGYIVTVTIGSKSTKAVLYNCTEEPAVPTPAPRVAINCIGLEGKPRRRRRRKKLSTTDPRHPKPNRSGYNFFFQDQHRKLKPELPGQDRFISKMIGKRWNALSPEDKAVYQEKGAVDKLRYQRQLAAYREAVKTGQPISNAVPIQQRPPQTQVTIDEVDNKVIEVDNQLSNQGYSSNSSSSSDESADSGEKNVEDDEEFNTETSPELSMETADSHGQPDPSADGDRFELRRRENPKIDDKRDMPPN